MRITNLCDILFTRKFFTELEYKKQHMEKCTDYVCEYWFKRSDDDQPNYSFEEYDIYGHITPTLQTRNHRLSVRKNLGTGSFEAYRQFMQKYHSDKIEIMDMPVDFTTQIDTGLSEIAFTGNFEQCLQYVTKEHNTNQNTQLKFCPCRHDHLERAPYCDYHKYNQPN